MPQTHPKLVFLFADQIRYHSCGFASPALRIWTASQMSPPTVSTRFPTHRSARPIAPRSSPESHQSSHGMVINELRLGPDHECFGPVLARAGYDTSYIGK